MKDESGRTLQAERKQGGREEDVCSEILSYWKEASIGEDVGGKLWPDYDSPFMKC